MNNQNRFDGIADTYDDLMRRSLSKYGKDIDYYSEYKVRKLKSCILENKDPGNILEFGCGTGRNIRHLVKSFPQSRITGCDISIESLKQASKENPEAHFITVEEAWKWEGSYDLILVSGVFHHMTPEEMDDALMRLHELLERSGELVVFEHNPANPVTVRTVKDCPFDKGVVLIKPMDLIRSASRANLRMVRKEYCLFFPSALRLFAPLEIFLSSLPLGAQYWIRFSKN